MTNRYIVFDVETPNSANDRISAIGITIVENGRIVSEFYTLVNPDTDFDDFNMNLTGITPETVADKPLFPELWHQIEPVMGSGLLIAHNAPFDMSVLAKCLNHYEIEWQPYTYYACTCSMGRACYPELPNHRLDTLCEYLKIDLSHHHAASDSHACAELLINYLGHGLNVDGFLRSYDIANIRTNQAHRKVQLSDSSRKLLELKTVLGAITADGILSDSETLFLQNWMDENSDLRGNFPFDKVFSVVEQALEDGILSNDELGNMLKLFEQITDPVANTACCDEFNIEGKTFCLTGEFNFGDRPTVKHRLETLGGIPVESVTKKTDYLIVGSKGSTAWVAGNYGTKVKKAMELQAKGSGIQLIKEDDIQKMLEGAV